MLETLPTELLQHIATFLEEDALAQLRLTSSRLRSTSYDAFGAAHFSLLETDLRRKSFKRIWQVAHHDIFKSAVRGLFIAHSDIPEPLEHNLDVYPWGSPGWLRQPSGSLDLNQPWIKTIRHTILKFANCNTFKFLDWADSPTSQPRRGPSSTDAIAIVLSNVALERMPIVSLDIALYSGVELEYDLLHPELYQLPSFQTVWGSNLRTFTLSGSLSCNDTARIVADIISRASNLDSLELFSIGLGNQEAGITCFRRLVQLKLPPQLSNLNIGLGTCMQSDILSLICTKSLKSIHLRSLHLLDGDPKAMFEDMREFLPPLDVLVLGSLAYRHGISSPDEQHYEPVFFHSDIQNHPQITGSHDLGYGYQSLEISGGSGGMQSALETIITSFRTISR